MAIIGAFTKQPGDTLDYDIDYTKWLVAGDEVTSAGAAVAPSGLTLVSVSEGVPDVVKVWVSGGTSGVRYKVTVITSTKGGRVKEDEFLLTVKEF